MSYEELSKNILKLKNKSSNSKISKDSIELYIKYRFVDFKIYLSPKIFGFSLKYTTTNNKQVDYWNDTDLYEIFKNEKVTNSTKETIEEIYNQIINIINKDIFTGKYKNSDVLIIPSTKEILKNKCTILRKRFLFSTSFVIDNLELSKKILNIERCD